MNILSWNIQWGRGVDGRVDLDRIVAEARRIVDFDVLCLQEVSAGFPELPGCDGGDQFAAIAARLPGYTAVAGVATDAPGPLGRRAFGNMILSRHPVGPVFRHLLPWPADPGVRSMQRVALEAVIDAPGGPLRVTTTHLEYYSVRQRAAQIERLRALHRDAVAQAADARPAAPVDGPFARWPRPAAGLICGDFNCLADSAEFIRLLADHDDGTPALQDAWGLVHRGRPHAHTVGLHDKAQWPGEPFTFDFFVVGSDLAPRVRGVTVDAASAASDHQPLWLELG